MNGVKKERHPIEAVVAMADHSPEMVIIRMFVKERGWSSLETRELNERISAIARENNLTFKQLNRVVREALLSI